MPVSTESTNGVGITADHQDPSDELRLSRERIAELESAGSDLVAQNENDAADTLKEIQEKIGRIENSVAWLQQGQLRCDRYKLWFATDPEEEQFKEIQDKIENLIARLQEGQLRCVSVESFSLLQEKIDELERNQKADQAEHRAKIDEGMDQLLKVKLSAKMEQYQMQQQQKMEQYQKEQQQKMQQYQKEQQQTIDELQKTVAMLNGTIGKVVFTLDLRRKKCHWTEVLENTMALMHTEAVAIFVATPLRDGSKAFLDLMPPSKESLRLVPATSSDAASIWQHAKSFTQKTGGVWVRKEK
uniref:TIR domain-containing protein n=1 Tax=Globodera pallida TaxID=36090 RepID=A0A183C4U6_GLOPA